MTCLRGNATLVKERVGTLHCGVVCGLNRPQKDKGILRTIAGMIFRTKDGKRIKLKQK